MDIKQELKQLLSDIELKTNSFSIDDNSSQIEIDSLLETTRKFYDILIDIKSKNFGKYEEPKPVEISLSESHINEIKDFIIEGLKNDVENIKSELISSIKESIIVEESKAESEDSQPQEILSYEDSKPEEVVSETVIEVEEDPKEKLVEESFIAEPSIEIGKSEVITEEASEPKAEEVIEEEIPNFSEEVETPEPIVEEKSVEHDLFSEIKSEKKSQAEEVIEKVENSENDEQLSLNERLSQNSEQINIADKLSSRKVEDLKRAIGINERFLFINELFQGNFQEYNNAIKLLNEISDIDNAMKYIDDDLNSKFDWNDKQEILADFKNIVKLKFA